MVIQDIREEKVVMLFQLAIVPVAVAVAVAVVVAVSC